MTLNHMHLASRNIAAAQAFFERYFDFRKERDHGRGVFLRDRAGFLLVLDPAEDDARLPAWFHFGFCLESEADVHAMHQKVLEGRAEIVRDLIAKDGEYAAFYVADPDGHRIEVSWDVD